MGAIASGVSAYALFSARRAETREDWRAAAMLFAVGPGLWVWAAGIAARLGDLALAGVAVMAALVLALGLLRFPEPPEDTPPAPPR